MFYNSKQKERYIENSRFAETTLEVAKQIFNGSSRVENQEGTDLTNFNRQQVMNLLKTYNSQNKYYYKLICNIFSDYYNWCLEEGLIDIGNVTNWYDVKLSTPIIEDIIPAKLVKDKYYNKEDVLEYISKVPDPSNKLLIYAFFLGIDGKEHEDIKYLSVNDYSENHKAIKLYSGRKVIVDDLFINLMYKADQSKYYYPDGNENANLRGRHEYNDSKYILKVCNTYKTNEAISNQGITQRLTLIRKQAGNKFISASTLYKNGLIQAIKDHFEEQGISLEQALYQYKVGSKKYYEYEEQIQEIIRTFGSNMEVKMLRLQMKDILQYYI